MTSILKDLIGTSSADGQLFCKMFRNAAAMVENNRTVLNELNVFPVPDGDTGTNMSLTIRTAADELAARCTDEKSITTVSDVIASSLLRGARGNSGVIMSLLFRGVSRYFKETSPDTADAAMFAGALSNGVDAAYKAVMKPAEGTILTVSRMAAKAAAEAARIKDATVADAICAAYTASLDALAKTTRQNPVLEKAGVVDAGAKGYCYILAGFVAALKGETVVSEDKVVEETTDNAFASFNTEDIKFTYCTEFIVLRSMERKSSMLLRAWLENMGDCVVVVEDDDIIKVHVHSNNPGAVLEEALTFGALTKIKIENMKEQHTEQLTFSAQRKIAPPSRRYGFTAVAAGDGICSVLRDLGVDGIVEGGQTMNPSTDDILKAIDAVPAEIVFVLPNNKNIIMAAEQAAPLSGKKVIVLPTKTIPQGISALLAFDASAEPEQNTGAMTAALSNVQTGQITYAARDAVFDDKKIKTGDILSLCEGRLISINEDINRAIDDMFDAFDTENASFITLFYGDGVSESDAEAVSARLAARLPLAEINLLCGGQPVYFYIASVE